MEDVITIVEVGLELFHISENKLYAQVLPCICLFFFNNYKVLTNCLLCLFLVILFFFLNFGSIYLHRLDREVFLLEFSTSTKRNYPRKFSGAHSMILSYTHTLHHVSFIFLPSFV
ncbi:hypothetical protein PanWU01x14_236040 [Parasponia andersonii]|uniref:Uncharacterized protein n=1 Tax=Parasponia andersonii TaxID=3476 RepID=A0A2P5BIM0_PARAD|nr:hypothetical protein PanWU01x14_236040 [Parasponia andersonii]